MATRDKVNYEKRNPKDRFMSFVSKVDGCWLWQGGCNKNGYGNFSLNNRTVAAHRTSYEFFVGSIQDGLQLDHLCRNRACVNPEHLEQVTQKENSLRGNTVNRINYIKTHCPQGHTYTDDNTYVCPKQQRHCRECGRAARKRYKSKKHGR